MDASRTLKNRRGIALVYLAILLFVLVGFAALTIDLGYFYVVKSQLQNAADASALAGVSGLKGLEGVNPYSNETTARTRSQFFAQQNNAANTPVLLDLNTTNDALGDILIGCWNSSTSVMNTSCSRPNSVQVNARRSSDTGIGRIAPTPVGTFFGKIFNKDSVNIGATAVAQRPSKPTVPLAHCLPICPDEPTHVSLPATFHLKAAVPSGPYPVEEVMGWTAFSADSNVSVGPNSDVVKYLRGELDIPPNLCGQIIKTNTGVGSIRPILEAAFEQGKNASGRWKVILPIFNDCSSVDQSKEKDNLLVRYAEAEITAYVELPADALITIDNVTCMPCATANFLSEEPKLVK